MLDRNNMAERSRHRELLRRFDHAAIFVMIAGTYTPFTTLGLRGQWAVAMTIFVWAVAVFGVVLKLSVSTERFAKLSMALYLTFGWIGMVIMWPLLASVGTPILLCLRSAASSIHWARSSTLSTGCPSSGRSGTALS